MTDDMDLVVRTAEIERLISAYKNYFSPILIKICLVSAAAPAGFMWQKGATISFWYDFEFGQYPMKSEKVGNYTYNYDYESLPWGYSKKWGSKRHVLIFLPKLEVTSLPPQ